VDLRAVGDPGVDKVDWPPELRVFKTADTTHYVAATAAAARVCATCLAPFHGDDRRSLTIEVRVPDPAPPVAGFLYRQFAAEVHHRTCRAPGLSVVTRASQEAAEAESGDPVDGELDMHYVLTADVGPDGDGLPSLVFTTSDPIVVRDLELAEGRSAWISTYLELGFELFAVGEISAIAAHAPIATAVVGTLDDVLFSLTGTLDGREVTLLQWTRNRGHAAYRSWRRAVADSGALLVLYGEYIHLDTDAGTVELAPGGRLGDIAAAVVRVEMTPPPGRGDASRVLG
jgi:hypothetical protein